MDDTLQKLFMRIGTRNGAGIGLALKWLDIPCLDK